MYFRPSKDFISAQTKPRGVAILGKNSKNFFLYFTLFILHINALDKDDRRIFVFCFPPKIPGAQVSPFYLLCLRQGLQDRTQGWKAAKWVQFALDLFQRPSVQLLLMNNE